MTTISKDLKSKYDSQYSDNTEHWRKMGAVGKVENIFTVTKNHQFNSLIDIGAGDGNVLSLLSEKNFCLNFTAAEISDSAIQQIKKKNIRGLSEVKQFDGYILPFADKQFDVAVCSHVIEHVEHPRNLLREIKRISKYQVFEVPVDFSFKVDKKFRHFNSYGHINIYTPALFNFLLLSEGFELLNHCNGLYKREVALSGIKKFSATYFAVFLKRILWKCLPILMQLKPNTYTVFTK